MYAYVSGSSFSSTEYSIKYEYTPIPIHDSEPIYLPSYGLTSDLDGDGFTFTEGGSAELGIPGASCLSGYDWM